jgi:DNA repair protein RadA/Sms
MAQKTKTLFICAHCGYQSLRWLGKCPECGSWDSFEEQVQTKKSDAVRNAVPTSEPIVLSADHVIEEERLESTIPQINQVLGGGIVAGSVIMIGGDPGIGKSTLMLQLLQHLPSSVKKLYISGEESFHQIKQRANRLDIDGETIWFLNDTSLENIQANLHKHLPKVVIIDSIQTVSSDAVDGVPGNVSQLRFCTGQLVQMAKQNHITIFLVGHVTKDGSIAGPKILEHVVDTVLYFEGDNQYDYRILRTTKNRFGPVNEIALFQMGSKGLLAVNNPSELFLNFEQEDRQGTAIISVMEGNHPMMVEVQALVTKTQFGIPQRTATGIDHRRMNLLLAVLEKKCAKPFSFHDVFIKTAAGLRLDEPAADLGICVALVSSLEDKPLSADTFYCGEVGLSGEIRNVQRLTERLNEAKRLGFKKAVVPKSKEAFNQSPLKIIPVRRIQEVLDKYL